EASARGRRDAVFGRAVREPCEGTNGFLLPRECEQRVPIQRRILQRRCGSRRIEIGLDCGEEDARLGAEEPAAHAVQRVSHGTTAGPTGTGEAAWQQSVPGGPRPPGTHQRYERSLSLQKSSSPSPMPKMPPSQSGFVPSRVSSRTDPNRSSLGLMYILPPSG